ncbi:MAG TPA: TolC family protein [Candidatus Binataceae bacterium]|nr:TolC family protein [Candidatus Binataceae bacterium]
MALRNPYAPVMLFLSALFALPAAAWGGEVLTLPQAISRALAYAPAVSAAIATTDLSSGKLTEARSAFYPDISGAGEYNQAPGYDQRISNRGLTLAQLQATYTVYDGGRREAQERAARYAEQAARLGIQAAQAQIVFDTTLAYFDLMRSDGMLGEHEKRLARLNTYVSIVEALQRNGRAIANDVLRVRTTRDQEQLALAAAREMRAHTSIVLGSLMGLFGRTDLQIANVRGLPSMPVGEVGQSPALRAAQRQVASAKLAVQAARAERYPTFKLALTSGYEGVDPPQTFSDHLGASYDGAVSLPIFDGGLITSHIQQARAAAHAAIANQRQIELQLKRDLADTNTHYRSALQQLAVVANSKPTADDAFNLDWARFLGGGSLTLFEVLDAFQQAENLHLTRLDEEFAARQAVAQAGLLLGITQ